MSILGQVRTMFSGQTQEAFGAGERHPLTKQIEKSIRRHIAGLRNTDLSAYEFERRPSTQRDAKSDLVIYDEAKNPVLYGRDMYGDTSFWVK